MRCAEHNLTCRIVWYLSQLFNASKIMFQILPAHSCSSPVYLTVGVDATGGGRALSRHQGHCDQAQDHGPQHCPHQPHPWHGQRRGVIKWVCKKQVNFLKWQWHVALKWQCFNPQTHKEISWSAWMFKKRRIRDVNWTATELLLNLKDARWLAQTKSAKWARDSDGLWETHTRCLPRQTQPVAWWRGSDFKQ